MKNLAICFSGAIRSFHLCHESIKKMIIDPLKLEYNVYIFGHFWTMKQDENLEDLTFRMKWKKESEGVYSLIKNFGFTQYVIEEYNAEREKYIMDNLGNLLVTLSQADKDLPMLSMLSRSNSSTVSKPANSLNMANTVSTAKAAKVSEEKAASEERAAKAAKAAKTSEETKSKNTNEEKSKEKLSNKILNTYNLIEDSEKKTQYLNYAVNAMGMYYKIMMSNRLKNRYAAANNVKFDYTIRMRPDFFWNDPIPKGIFEDITDKNIVLVYDNYCTRAKWQGNDKFFAGTDTMMNEYCDMYNNFDYFFDKGIRIEGQELAQGMVKKMNLKIVFFGTENTYDKVAGSVHRRLERELARKKKSQESIY